MNKNTSMTIRLDPAVKRDAQAIFAELGMDMTTAINVFLVQSIRQRGLPFEVTLHTPNATTATAIEDALAGNDIRGPFTSVSDLMEDLNADD